MEILETDFLIIGAGAAGSIYTHQALKEGKRCILISAENSLSQSNSHYAQGGIIYDTDSDKNSFRQDILTASNFFANPQAVEIIINQGDKILKELLLDDIKVPFDRDEDDNLLFTKEAAHSKSRIIFCKDKTGEIFLHFLHESLRRQKENGAELTILNNSVAIDLLTLSHSSKNQIDKYRPLTCIGAYVLNSVTGKILAITSKKTVLATGGIGQLYLNTTNYSGAFGHGIAMAQRIGARVMDMEYIQFHPTAFYQKGAHRSFLISEAVRGEGGILINGEGRTFMDDYHPLKSLAPRDVIARSINSEMIKTNTPCVYLDLSHLSGDYIRSRFPNINKKCLSFKIDMVKNPIPVAPAAHYFCGGIHANMSGDTNILNLKAIGETACSGLHGTNRLASTSLLECVVMGYLSAKKDTKEIEKYGAPDPSPIREWESPLEKADEDLIKQDINLIKNTMWNYVGLVRTHKRLLRAQNILHELKREVDEFYANCQLTQELLNLRNGIKTAQLVVYAALQNKESSGCHFRDER